MVLASLHAAFTFGLLLRKAVRSGLRAFKAFHRCLEPLRSKVGGPIKALCHVMRDGTAWGIAVYSLLLIVNSLRLISWLFADNLQISC